MKLQLNTHKFLFYNIGKKTLIYSGDNSLLYTFNDTASLIMSKLRLGWTLERIIDFISFQTGADKKVVKRDVEQFVSELLKNKLVERV